MAMIGTKLAVMAVDPGGTTGIAWGVFNLHHESIVDILDDREFDGDDEITGPEVWQAVQIVERWIDFEMFARIKFNCHESVLVFEDFVLRVGKGTSDRVGISPVRITSLVEGMLTNKYVGTSHPMSEELWFLSQRLKGVPLKLQQPGAAKGFATKERLQRWNLWTGTGRHARDAWRHICLAIVDYEKWKARR